MSYSIPATIREGRGKGDARKQRAKGTIPAVIYGHGVEKSLSVSIDPKVLLKGLEEPKGYNTVFSVPVEGGETYTVFVRELQRHPVSRNVLHVDFVSPDMDRPTVGEVPIITTGKSIGVAMGGKLAVPYRAMKVLAKPADFPVDVTIDITEMNHNDVVKASDVELPEGVTAIYDRDYVVVKITPPRGKKKTAEEAEEK